MSRTGRIQEETSEKIVPIGPVGAFAALARERPLALAAWLFGLLLAFQVEALDFGYAISHGQWRTGEGTLLGRDFVNVFTAGHLMFQDALSTIYDVDAYRRFQDALFGHRVIEHNYSYAPVSFFYVWPFALLPYPLAYAMWIGVTASAFAIAARPYLRDAGLPTWIAVLTPAAAMNVWAGQYGFFLGALWLGAWSLLESRPRTAGVLIGLMIVKPHLALLIPLVLAVRRAWRTFAYAGMTALLLAIASGLMFGWQLWADYISHTLILQASMVDQTESLFLRMMPTAYPVFRLAGVPSGMAWAFQGACALGAIIALVRWTPRDARSAGLATATATFLVLPYAFNYDLTVVAVAAALMLHRAPDDAPLHRISAALTLILPSLVIFSNTLSVPIAPPILLLFLGAQLACRSSAFPTQLRPAVSAAVS